MLLTILYYVSILAFIIGILLIIIGSAKVEGNITVLSPEQLTQIDNSINTTMFKQISNGIDVKDIADCNKDERSKFLCNSYKQTYDLLTSLNKDSTNKKIDEDNIIYYKLMTSGVFISALSLVFIIIIFILK